MRRSKKDGSFSECFRRDYPRLWLLADCSSHLVLSIHTGRGPGNEISGWKPLLQSTEGRYRFRKLVADAAYDCEEIHEYIDSIHKARSLIPPTKTRKGRRAKKPFRKLMEKLFFRTPKAYKRRWQVESVISMIKRNLSASLKARSQWTQSLELSLLAITHNIMIVAALLVLTTLFYRARRWNCAPLPSERAAVLEVKTFRPKPYCHG